MSLTNLGGGKNFLSEKVKFSGNASFLFQVMVNPWPLAGREDILRNSPESKSWEASALRDLNSTEGATFEKILLSFLFLENLNIKESGWLQIFLSLHWILDFYDKY